MRQENLCCDSAASGRVRSESAARERFAGLMLEIQSFTLDHQRTVMHLRVYVPDVLADDAHEEKLERSQEEHSDGDGCDAKRELMPEQQFVCKVSSAPEHGQQRSGKTRERD